VSPELVNQVCWVRGARRQHQPMSVNRGLSDCIQLYPAATSVRLQSPFQVFQVALKFIDALFQREYVVAGRVVHVFHRFGEPRNLGP